MTVGHLPPGSKGFDCNTTVLPAMARRFKEAGYDFAMRYVPRVVSASHDISIREAEWIRSSGLALGLVQHVAKPGWFASVQLGRNYGMTAARSAADVGYPTGCVIWCDLEEVAAVARAEDVIAYCNAWYDQVKIRGYEPGLYVGYGARLNAGQLYIKLRFRRYWSAYNLNADQFPAVRGVQMRQLPYPAPGKRVLGVPFEYDENVVLEDKLGSSPLFWLAKSNPQE